IGGTVYVKTSSFSTNTGKGLSTGCHPECSITLLQVSRLWTQGPDCPSTEKFDEEGKPKQNRRHSFPKKKKKATVVEAVDTEHVHFAVAVRGKKDFLHGMATVVPPYMFVALYTEASCMMLSTWTNPEACKALGNLVVKTKNGTRTIHDVHYFPDSNVSLLSLVVFNQRGFDFKTAGVKQLVVTKGNKEVLSFQRNGPLYQLEGVCVPPDRVLAVADIDVWHRRMGHASAAKLHQLSQSGFAMPNLKGQTLGACSSQTCVVSHSIKRRSKKISVIPSASILSSLVLRHVTAILVPSTW
ncbi:unnamed protein product, partial [Aphanomyces euteiches]